MTETHTHIRTADGTPRIALDDGAKAEVSRSILQARAQFDAAFANIARTIEGENTVRGGTAEITGFSGARDSVVSRAAQTIINAIRGDREQQLQAQQELAGKSGQSR